MPESLTGTAAMVRLALRRDRFLLSAWILGFAAMAGVSASATVGLYPDEAQRVQAAELVNATSSLVALYGPIYDPTSIGALSLFKLTAFGAAIVALLMVFVVVRHTRAEEEAGRLELMGSVALGRIAPLAAALIVAIGASLVLGAASAVALIAAGLDVEGSFAFGMGWAFTGIAFASLAGVPPRSPPGPVRPAAWRSSPSRWRTGCGRSATSPRVVRTGCRGCPRSAGCSRSAPTPVTVGGYCCSRQPWPRSASR